MWRGAVVYGLTTIRQQHSRARETRQLTKVARVDAGEHAQLANMGASRTSGTQNLHEVRGFQEAEARGEVRLT